MLERTYATRALMIAHIVELEKAGHTVVHCTDLTVYYYILNKDDLS